VNINQIKTFYLVATLGTYQAAAERMHATQPAISARIAALENALQFQLFDRSSYRVSLTPQGRSFLPYAEQVLELLDKAVVSISKADELSGSVRIGASDTMVSSWLPDFLVSLHDTHPGITVEIFIRASPHLRDDLLSHGIDIAFLVGSISNPSVINQDFCECSMGLVASPDFWPTNHLTPQDLSGTNILTFEKVTQPYLQLQRLLKQHGIVANLNPITALHSIVILTSKGLGIGYVPLVAVQEELRTGQLVRLPDPFDLPPLSFSISYLDGPHRGIVETIAHAASLFLKMKEDTDFIKISD
jgi:DNA-binding transcriptional LysR family regulator